MRVRWSGEPPSHPPPRTPNRQPLRGGPEGFTFSAIEGHVKIKMNKQTTTLLANRFGYPAIKQMHKPETHIYVSLAEVKCNNGIKIKKLGPIILSAAVGRRCQGLVYSLVCTEVQWLPNRVLFFIPSFSCLKKKM